MVVSLGLLKKQVKTEINLRYKGQLYQLLAEWKTKYETGHSGAIRYKQLRSFYPISDSRIIQKLRDDYKEEALNSDLSLFLHKS